MGLLEESRGGVVRKDRRKILRGLTQGLRNSWKGKEYSLRIIGLWDQWIESPSIS